MTIILHFVQINFTLHTLGTLENMHNTDRSSHKIMLAGGTNIWIKILEITQYSRFIVFVTMYFLISILNCKILFIFHVNHARTLANSAYRQSWRLTHGHPSHVSRVSYLYVATTTVPFRSEKTSLSCGMINRAHVVATFYFVNIRFWCIWWRGAYGVCVCGLCGRLQTYRLRTCILFSKCTTDDAAKQFYKWFYHIFVNENTYKRRPRARFI